MVTYREKAVRGFREIQRINQTLPAKLKLWLYLLFLALLAYIAWEFYRFITILIAADNRPYLMRTLLQSAEWGLVFLLLKRMLLPTPTGGGRFEMIMLLLIWILFLFWMLVLLPVGFWWRDGLLYGGPDLQFMAQINPALTSFPLYLFLLWGATGLALFLLYIFKKRYADVDEILLPTVAFMIFTGILLLARLGPDLPKAAKLAYNQCLYLLVGVFAAGFAMHPKLRDRWLSLARYPYVLLLVALMLIGGTFFFGKALSGGKTLWYQLGPLTIQPIEISKILFVFVAAVFLEKKSFLLQKLGRKSDLVTFAGICGVFFLLLIFQKDLGPVLVLSLTCLWLFLTVSKRWWVCLGGTLAIAVLVLLSFWSKTPPMVYTRIMDFLDPLQHSGQLTAGLWAQGSGGIWGTGLGLSKAYRIPIIESDYIFSALVAEKGFMGAAVFVIMLLIFCVRGVQNARFISAGNQRDATFLLGLTMLVFVQGFLIMAGNMAYFPLSGLTLPFVSAGGSSLVINLVVVALMFGMVARNVKRRTLQAIHS